MTKLHLFFLNVDSQAIIIFHNYVTKHKKFSVSVCVRVCVCVWSNMPFLHFRSESISNLKMKTNKTLNCERTPGNCGTSAI